MKRALLLFAFLAIAVSARAQGIGRYDSIVFGNSGRPQPNANVAICDQPADTSTTPCTVLATTYTDDTGSTICNGSNGCSNPVVADGLGNWHFYGHKGTKYTYQFYGVGITTKSLVDQELAGGGGCDPGAALDGVVFNNPLGSCETSSTFTATPQSGADPNKVLAVDLNHGTTFQIESLIDPTHNYIFSQGHQVFGTSNSSNYDGSTNDGFTFYVDDSATPPQSAGAITGTNVTVASGTLTVAASGASTLFFNPGTYAYFSGCATATFLNGQVVQVANASTTQFVALNTGFSDYSSAADSCTVKLQASSNPIPFYSNGGVKFGGDYIGFYSDTQATGENPQAHSTTDFLAEAFGDGPEYGTAFGAREHRFVGTESSQFRADSDGTGFTAHTYTFKVGNENETPRWWVTTEGHAYSRKGVFNIASTSLGSCSFSPGLSDCTPTIASSLLGPPASEVIQFKVCATGALYDTMGWKYDAEPSCASAHLFPASTSPTLIADGISVTFGAATGHTLNAIGLLPITVTHGTQLAQLGGNYLAGAALPAPIAPFVSTPGGGTTWTYCTTFRWNGFTTDCSPTTTVLGPATLDVGDFLEIATTSPTDNPEVFCYIYRTVAGGTPSTTGLIAGPVACGTQVVDNGLAGDSATAPSVNLTGHTVLADGYLEWGLGAGHFTLPQITGTGPICIASGVVSNTAGGCGGGGGTPGGDPGQLQWNSAGSFAGVANSSVDIGTGAITLSPTNTFGLLIQATGGDGDRGAFGVLNDVASADIPTSNQTGMQVGVTATDNAGQSASPTAAIFDTSLLGSNVAGAIALGIVVEVDNQSTGGNAAELVGIQVNPRDGGHVSPVAAAVLVAGIHVLDQNGGSVPGSAHNAGILFDAQTAGTGVYDIETLGTTPSKFGGFVNSVTGFEFNSAAPSGHYLRGNGTNYIDGTIQAGDLPAAVVLNNQSNTFSTGSQDFTSATHLKVPSGAGATASAIGDILEDTTGKNYHNFDNGVDSIFAAFATALAPVNNNCVKWVNSGGHISLGDQGTNCGAGGGGAGTVTSVSSGNLTAFATVSVATATVTPAFSFALTTASANQFWGGPTSGGATAPAYRALVSADIPNNAANTSGSAGSLSASSALPNGTTCTTQSTGDSTTKCATDQFVANTFAAPPALGSGTPATVNATTIALSSQLTSTQATGSSPFVVASTTVVANLNSSLLLGGTWAIPGTIGSTTPNSIAGTTLAISSTVSGAGFTAYLASPPAIGGSSPAPGAFTTLTSSSTTTLNGTTIPASSTLTRTLGSGSVVLSVSAINPGACATAITAAVSGMNTGDNIALDFASSPLAVTGYSPAGATVTVYKWPTAGFVNVAVCNSANNPSPITPGAMNANYHVFR